MYLPQQLICYVFVIYSSKSKYLLSYWVGVGVGNVTQNWNKLMRIDLLNKV